MKVLTLHRPWSWACTLGPKRVENRDWPPPRALIGQPLLIHGGQKYDQDGARFIAGRIGKVIVPTEALYTGVVGICRVARVVKDPLELPVDQVQWFFGLHGWVFEDVIPLKPYACSGHQGLWDFPDRDLSLLEPARPGQRAELVARYPIRPLPPAQNFLDVLYDKGRR